jgi:hypothetical protein
VRSTGQRARRAIESAIKDAYRGIERVIDNRCGEINTRGYLD